MSDCAPSKPPEIARSVAGRSSSLSRCSASRVVSILKRAGLDYTLIAFGKTHQARGEYRVVWCRLEDKIPKTQQIAAALTAAGVKCSTDALHNVNQAAVYLRLPNVN